MEKIIKFLNKLTEEEQIIISTLIELVLANETKDLDIKKLTGHKDIYRVRSGKIRVIFLRQDTDISVLEISRRNDNTYRNY